MKTEAQSQLAVVSERFTSIHPEYKTARRRIEDISQSIENYAVELTNSIHSEHAAAEQRANNLETQLGQLQEEFAGFKSTSAEFRGLKDEVDRNWNTHSKLQQRIMDLDLDPETLPSFLTTVTHPVVPDKKSSPKTLFRAAGGLFLGGLISVALIGWNHRRGLPFTSKDQSGKLLGIPQISELVVPRSNDWEEAIRSPGVITAIRDLMIVSRNMRVVQITATPDCNSGNSA